MAAPSIEGTYQLVRRELPDGTLQTPPTVKGLITYTREFRNFSVVWKDAEGRYYSECYVARYSLSDTEYQETAEYLIAHDEISGKPIHYDLSATTASSPVAREGDRIAFDLPQAFERALSIRVEIDGKSFKATGQDLFVDYWERVD